jgi:threonine/homoserine/homoserine lactone efflux protein
MSFNPKALLVSVAFFLLLVLAVNRYTVAAIVVAIGIILDLSMWFGVFSSHDARR